MRDRNIYIVYNGVHYRLVQGRDCTNHCSFRKDDGPFYCERGCYLPSWIKRLRIGVDYWIERVDPKVELIKKVKRSAKKTLEQRGMSIAMDMARKALRKASGESEAK